MSSRTQGVIGEVTIMTLVAGVVSFVGVEMMAASPEWRGTSTGASTCKCDDCKCSTDKKESEMREWRFKIQTKDGRRIEDTARASSIFDAKKTIESRYPGCVILGQDEIK